MSRVSDTRLRTRETAVRLVAAGRRPHELTVDLIYAEIRQGSRTTINDELKLWKDEQAKADALSAALPEPVAKAMLAAWAVAVEHGEQVFDRRRAEVESELTQAAACVDAAETARSQAAAEIAALKASMERIRTELEVTRLEAQHERAAKEAALERAATLEDRLAADHAAAQRQLEEQRESYELQLNSQRDQLAASEAGLREELARATERLEGVQKHVMLHVAEARQAQRRAEDQLAKAVQRNEQLSTEAESLRAEAASLTTRLQRLAQDYAIATQSVDRLQVERDELTVGLAKTNGRLEAALQHVADLMGRLNLPVKSQSALSTRKRPK